MQSLRSAHVLAKVVATLGILLAREGLSTDIWGSESKIVPLLFSATSSITLGKTHLGTSRLCMFGIAVVSAVLLWCLYSFTRLGPCGMSQLSTRGLAALVVGNMRRSATGRCMLAVCSDERAAPIAGVNVARVKLQGFMLSSAIAALGAAYWHTRTTTLSSLRVRQARLPLRGQSGSYDLRRTPDLDRDRQSRRCWGLQSGALEETYGQAAAIVSRHPWLPMCRTAAPQPDADTEVRA